MMDDLFLGDDGLQCPNAIGAAKLNQLKSVIENGDREKNCSLQGKLLFSLQIDRTTVSIRTEAHWISWYGFIVSQSVRVIDNESDDESGCELSEELERVMGAVRERVKTRMEMALSLTEMEKGR